MLVVQLRLIPYADLREPTPLGKDAKGSFGDVYKAKYNGAWVAVKVGPPFPVCSFVHFVPLNGCVCNSVCGMLWLCMYCLRVACCVSWFACMRIRAALMILLPIP